MVHPSLIHYCLCSSLSCKVAGKFLDPREAFSWEASSFSDWQQLLLSLSVRILWKCHILGDHGFSNTMVKWRYTSVSSCQGSSKTLDPACAKQALSRAPTSPAPIFSPFVFLRRFFRVFVLFSLALGCLHFSKEWEIWKEQQCYRCTRHSNLCELTL